MASTSGNGSTDHNFKGGNVMPQEAGTAAGFNPSNYHSNGGKRRSRKTGGALEFSVLKGGALAFSELKGGKKRRSRKTAKRVAKKTSKRRGKKSMKNMLKGLLGIFKK